MTAGLRGCAPAPRVGVRRAGAYAVRHADGVRATADRPAARKWAGQQAAGILWWWLHNTAR